MYSQTLNPPKTPIDRGEHLSAKSPIVKALSNPSYWTLFNYINYLTGKFLSDQDKAVIMENVSVKKLRKRQYFLQEGDVCKFMGFIVKGSARMYSINERGQECIATFSLENSWITDQESFKNATPSNFHIEAMENTEILMVSSGQLGHLVEQLPIFASMLLEYQALQLIAAQQRINTALSMTAEERYHDLLQYNPQYAQRFSQNMLAGYLGLKPETLSRIRKR